MPTRPIGAVSALGALALVLLAVVAGMLTYGVVVGVELAARGGSPGEAVASMGRDPLALALCQLVGFGLAAGVGVLATRGGDVTYREALRVVPVPPALAMLAITGGFALQFPLTEVANLLGELGGPFTVDPLRQASLSDAIRIDGIGDAITIPLALVALTPIGEELFFRGLVLPGFEVKYGPRAALIASSVLFGLVHIALPAAAVYATLAGLALGWLRQRTDSVLPCIAAHGAFNAAPIVLSSQVLSIEGFNQPGDAHLPFGLLLGSLAVVALAFFALARLTEDPFE